MAKQTKSDQSKKLRAIFFNSCEPQANDNFERIPRAFNEIGWEVIVEPHQSLKLEKHQLLAGTNSMEEFDLIWPIGFGEKDNFLDRLQLLSLCPEEKMVNSPRSWLTAHGKAKWLKFSPVSFISSDPNALITFMQEHGGRWVLKPNAGSFGRNIHFFDTSENGVKTIQRICSAEKEFFILQRYLPEILEGETRCLYANGSIIGCYLKLPQNDASANVALGATISKTSITLDQEKVLSTISSELEALQIGFAAIDLVKDTLMEVNIANPGGLQSLESLYQRDFSEDLAARITERFLKHQD